MLVVEADPPFGDSGPEKSSLSVIVPSLWFLYLSTGEFGRDTENSGAGFGHRGGDGCKGT